VTRHRWEGFCDAWRQEGGASAELRIAVCPANSAAHGEAVTDTLLRSADRPDAIAAMSDELALGALRAVARADLQVPDVVAVTGWDDSDAAVLARLSTLRQSLREQGRRCARVALGHRDAQAAQDQPGWQVIERATTRGRLGPSSSRLLRLMLDDGSRWPSE
jgi:DNA-binding LacI/PurR family transcriptional regulator